VGSIPDGVLGIFPSGCTTVLGSTQPLTETSTRESSLGRGGKGGRCVGLTTLPTSSAYCVEILDSRVKWTRGGGGGKGYVCRQKLRSVCTFHLLIHSSYVTPVAGLVGLNTAHFSWFCSDLQLAVAAVSGRSRELRRSVRPH
jgi:hypothetical protein